MPPIREHSHSSDEETSNLLGKRGKKSPSINTRASRVGVTNFINVIKSLHPGESINYFPITKETLQQYIDSKRKANIKAGSLEQYLQHIQAYNLALGFGWDGQAFGPIIKKALDELRLSEETIIAQSSQIDASPDPLNENANRITRMLTIGEDNSIEEPISLDEKNLKVISLVCFDTTTILERRVQVSLDNIKHAEPLLNLRQLYSNISSATIPTSWGSVDLLCLYYRIGGTRDDSQHFELNDESAFVRFWTSFNEQAKVQLIVYRKNNSCSLVANHNSKRSEPLPHFRDVDTPPTTLKSITIRSKARVYKQRIAVSDTTTFVSLISFAIGGTPPSGKQFVIRDSASDLEYMPDDVVREVIKGVEHADVTVTIEDVNSIDFDCF